MTDPGQHERAYQSGLTKAHNDLERFLREDGTNVFTQPAWNGDKPKLTEADVNGLLDKAAPGLQWFERALVRYHRVWDLLKLPGFESIEVPALSIDGVEAVGAEHIDTTDDPLAQIHRLEFEYYDQQRSMNLASLRDLGTKITAAAIGSDSHNGVADITADLSGVARAVPEVWQGQGGDAANDHLAGFQAHADQQTQYLQAVSAALNGLPDVLLQIVRDKADFISGFDSPQCPVAGHAMRLGDEDPVSTIITVAAEKGKSHSLKVDREVVAGQFHLGVDTDDTGTSEWKNMVRDACEDWLVNHFAIAVREAFTAFVHQCALADFYIRRAYQPVTDLLDTHDSAPFPKPPGHDQPGPSSPVLGPSGTETSTHASAVDPGSVSPSVPQQAPTPATPAATQTNPLQMLSTFASQAGQTVQQGLGQLQSTVGQSISSPTSAAGLDSATSDPGAGGSKTLASMNLTGGNLTLTQAPNGILNATVTGPDGKSQRYSIGIKDGKPFFTENSNPATQPADSGTKPRPVASHSGGLGRGPSVSAGLGDGSTAGSSEGVPKSSTPHAMVPSTTYPAATTGASTTDSSAASGSAMPMSGMPMGGGGMGGAKGGSDGERSSKGIVPPRKLWRDTPGPDSSALQAPTGSDQWPDESLGHYSTSGIRHPRSRLPLLSSRSPPPLNRNLSRRPIPMLPRRLHAAMA